MLQGFVVFLCFCALVSASWLDSTTGSAQGRAVSSPSSTWFSSSETSVEEYCLDLSPAGLWTSGSTVTVLGVLVAIQAERFLNVEFIVA